MEKNNPQEVQIVNPEDILGTPFSWELEQQREIRLVGEYDLSDKDIKLFEIMYSDLIETRHRVEVHSIRNDGDYVVIGLFVKTGAKPQ